MPTKKERSKYFHYSTEQAEEITRLRRKGLKWAEIANKVILPSSTCHHWFNRLKHEKNLATIAAQRKALKEGFAFFDDQDKLRDKLMRIRTECDFSTFGFIRASAVRRILDGE